jgi:mRNA interferase MazF
MTTKGRAYPTRVPVKFEGKDGQIVLDQIRTIDKSRLIKKLGAISALEAKFTLRILREMFAEKPASQHMHAPS